MRTITADASLPFSSLHGNVPRDEAYESPVITTYTEAELLAALGPAHAGLSPGDGFMNDVLNGLIEEPDW